MTTEVGESNYDVANTVVDGGGCESGDTSAPDSHQDDEPGWSHVEAMTMVEAGLEELIKNDPLLCDLPGEITVEEVKSQIALEYGQSITVYVKRADGEILPIVVVQGATVRQLKDSIKRHLILRQHRKGGTRHISWPYVWRTYFLYFNGQKLSDDKKLLKDYGIRNKDEVTFIKRVREK